MGHTPGRDEDAQDRNDQVEGANEEGARLQGAAAAAVRQKSHDPKI